VCTDSRIIGLPPALIRRAWRAILLFSICCGGCAGVNGQAAGTGSGGQVAAGGSSAGGSGASGGTGGAIGTGGSACGGAAGCRATLCGNGQLNPPAETCDDGNQKSGDGCSPDCHTETDWVCATPGKPCTYAVVCGDGLVAGMETCDDHNTEDGDGCDHTCRLESGWTCPQAGAPCVPRCGDGKRLGAEQCDDGNNLAGDGCSDTCRIEPGFACPTAGQLCHRTVCGDGNKEGAESCDDGNTVAGDGCGADCRSEPVCAGTSGCTSPCGDGLKLPGEECDDGNTVSGDGCSADCKLEPNWDCRAVSDAEDGTLVVPVVYRDFLSYDHDNGHPNFGAGVSGTVVPGMVQATLGADRKPLMVDPPPANSFLTTSADFDQWYHDSPLGSLVLDTLTLTQQANGTFVYDHSEMWSNTAPVGWITPPFFPLDDRGWALPPNGPEIPYLAACDNDQMNHNYSFTSEVRYWFQYAGGEVLEFIGDDDVWVFVNGQLAVDLGGVHSASSGSVTLDAVAAAKFGLTVGRIYEIAVFQAERHMCGSSYKLTLGAFVRQTTVCTAHCGDGIVNGTEVCDDGVNDGRYGGCNPGCDGLGPYCGDGAVAAGIEDCDDGRNTSTYGQSGCGPGCKTVPRCGDGRVDGLYGETCDDGNTDSGDGCSSTCQIEFSVD
jgi:fibro-slime domain-containing protein